jgi:hypothetical protein
LADGCGAGIGRIGHGQLGGHQHRLAAGRRHLGRRFGEPAVLALVEGDDAFESVVGIVGAVT